MFIYKTDVDFTDKVTGHIYREGHLYFSDDETRAEALASTDNDRETVLIHKLTKKELVELADKYNVDIDKKSKVDELHERLSEALYQPKAGQSATMVVL